MITVKDYAKERGISIQAVHKSMAGKRKAARLQGHVQLVDGVKWLDDIAVEILDESRSQAPTIILDNAKDAELVQLRNRVLELEERIERKDVLYEKLQERLDRKETLLIDTENQLKAIEEKRQDQVDQAVKNIEIKYQEELQHQQNDYEEQIRILQAELAMEKNKSWLQKLLKKG